MMSPDVYVKSIRFTAFLTSARIIFRSTDDSRMSDKDLARDTIDDVFAGQALTGDPVLTLLARSRLGETRKMNLTFHNLTSLSRGSERDGWIRHLMNEYPAKPGQVPRSSRPTPASAGAQIPYTEGKLKFNTGIHATKMNAPSAASGYSGASLKEGGKCTTPERVSRDVAARPRETRDMPLVIREGAYPPKKSVPSAIEESPADYCFCTKCGSRVTKDSLFCDRCGSGVIVPDRLDLPDSEGCVRSRKYTSPAVMNSPMGASPVQMDTVHWDPSSKLGLAISGTDNIREPVTVRYTKETPGSARQGRVNSRTAVTGYGLNVSGKKGIVFIVVAALFVAITAGYFLFPGIIFLDNSTHIPASGAVLPGTPTPQEPVKGSVQTSGSAGSIVPQPSGSVPVPSDGIYIRVTYSGAWQGSYGTASDQTPVTSSGEKVYRVADAQEPVIARIQKIDNSDRELVVGIYCDGQMVKSGTNSDPVGSVSITAEV
ncbi:MAG: zinc ribbon domain-containing protein [Methanoregula sp.]|jgi:hypothetical protein